MTAVRRAVGADLPHLLALGRREHAWSRFAAQPFDEALAAQNLAHAVNSPACAVFVSAGGFIAGMVQPCLFNRHLTAFELCWYAEDGTGLALLDALTRWARDMRAVACVTHNYAGVVPADRMAKVLARRGYARLGETYINQLEEAK